MAALDSSSIDDIWAQVMRKFSAVRHNVPVTKSQLRALIVIMDSELDTAESAVLSAIPAGPGKTWLVANPALAREIMVMTEEKRQEVL